MTSHRSSMLDQNPRMRKADQSQAIAVMFTQFLIDSHAVTPERTRIQKNKLLEYYSTFQAQIPSYVKSTEIIFLLRENRLLVKKKINASEDEMIEFKKIIFSNLRNGPPIDVEKLQRPKVRIFINESKIFQNSTRKGLAVNGRECLMCKTGVFPDDRELNVHVNSDIHRFRELYRTRKSEFAFEMEGISINNVNRKLQIDEGEVRDESAILISNTSDRIFKIRKDIALVDLDEVQVRIPSQRTIAPGATFEYKLIACFTRACTYEYPVVFVIESDSNSPTHNLLTVAIWKVYPRDLQELCADAPYEPSTKKWIVFEDAPVVSAVPLQSAKMFYKIALKQYKIPLHLIKFLMNGFKYNEGYTEEEVLLLKKIKKILVGNASNVETFRGNVMWTSSNYVERFQLLLHLEEYQRNRSMLSYNRDNVTLSKGEQGKWNLEIPGLSEGRPSVLKGDSIFVWPANRKEKFEGVVHNVRENTASLVFNEKFNYLTNQKLDVEFQLNRLTLRIAQRALELVSKECLVSLMFPTKPNDSLPTYTITRCYNKQIEDNYLQKLAVNNIFRNTAYPAPYIVYGPPGTGKTSTLVEAITQLVLRKTQTICACAPSNAAANLLASKLIKHIPESQVLRLFSLSYNARAVPQDLRRCSNFNGEGNDLLFPSLEVIKSKKVVVLTPITAGRLYGVLGEGYFDYLFFDEAGQSEEPLTLVPFTGLLKRESGKVLGSLILAGDPNQLGPIIHSRMAATLGLSVPMIERLMHNCRLYQKRNDVYNVNFITKLTYNYRSHHAIIQVPKELFYEKELEARADPSITQWLCSWDKLPKKNVPLIFHGVKGKDDRESSSPSYFNLEEIIRVGDYLTDLIGTKISGREVKQEDVVVLAPYRKQVQKFRKYFEKRKWQNIQVSSIEQFQGQEKFVVILSCVRSRKEFLPSDYQFGLGFLRNPKRFNVALTRAKSLMIVVGNPDILQCDPYWRKFLQYCKTLGCYTGASPDGPVDDLDPSANLALDFSSLVIDDVPDEEKPSFPKDD